MEKNFIATSGFCPKGEYKIAQKEEGISTK